MTAQAQVCPRCSSPMILRTAGRGRFEGQQFWAAERGTAAGDTGSGSTDQQSSGRFAWSTSIAIAMWLFC